MPSPENVAGRLLSLMPVIRERLLKPGEAAWRSRLSTLQFFTLSLLQKRGPLTMGDLAQHLQVSKQQLTSIVDRLIEQDAVCRGRDAGDRRVVNVDLTSGGADLLESVRGEARRALASKLAPLSEAELEELERSISKVQEILGRVA